MKVFRCRSLVMVMIIIIWEEGIEYTLRTCDRVF